MSRISAHTRAQAELILRRRRREGRQIATPRPPLPPPIYADLLPKQRLVAESRATEILFGGAAGPGKSYLLRALAVQAATELPGCQIYLFRRTHPELKRNHLEGSTSLHAMLAPWTARGLARFNGTEGTFEVGAKAKRPGDPQPSIIHLCHLQHAKDLAQYQGAEIHLLLPDELTHFTADEYRYLRGRVRLFSYRPPEEAARRFEARHGMPWTAFLPRIVAGTNPGGIGHNWVRAAFVNHAPLELRQMGRMEGGMIRQFVPALLADNPYQDEGYDARLASLSPHLAKAMLDGSWDIVEGGALDDLWNPDVHYIAPFPIPSSWTINAAMDWGSSHPYSIGFWAESDGTEATLADGRRRTFSAGTLFRIGELYGCARDSRGAMMSNTGLRRTAAEVAAEMADFLAEAPWGDRCLAGPADTKIFDAGDDPGAVTIARQFEASGIRWVRAWKDPGSRVAGLEALRARLRASYVTPMEDPGLFIFTTCPSWRDTVPVLPRSKKNPDDVDTAAEDHAYDETRYRLSWVPTAPEVVAPWTFGMERGGGMGWLS